MSASSEQILSILARATAPMTVGEIYEAGDFENSPLCAVTLKYMSQDAKVITVDRAKNVDGKYVYSLRDKSAVVVPHVPQSRNPKLATAKPKPAPANDGAYAAVLFDLRRKREGHAAEIVKIDAAVETLEALA